LRWRKNRGLRGQNRQELWGAGRERDSQHQKLPCASQANQLKYEMRQNRRRGIPDSPILCNMLDNRRLALPDTDTQGRQAIIRPLLLPGAAAHFMNERSQDTGT